MKRELKVRELTPEGFAPYGSVMSTTGRKPKFDEEIFTFWDELAVMKNEGDTGIGLLEIVSRGEEFSKLERHVRTQEIFFALDGDVILLVGEPTPEEDHPDPETVAAFRLEAGEGVLINRGTWHWVPYPYGDKARLLVIFRAGTPDKDTEIKDMQEIEGIGFTIGAGL